MEDVFSVVNFEQHEVSKTICVKTPAYVFRNGSFTKIDLDGQYDFRMSPCISVGTSRQNILMCSADVWCENDVSDEDKIYMKPCMVFFEDFCMGKGARVFSFCSTRGFYEGFWVNGGYLYDASLNGTRKATKLHENTRMNTKLPLIEGIPHGKLEKHKIKEDSLPLAYVDGESISIIQYESGILDGVLNNGLFTGSAVLKDSDGKICYEGYFLADLAYEGDLIIDGDKYEIVEFIIKKE